VFAFRAVIQTPGFAAGPRERVYAEWFVWARINIGPDPKLDHRCAQAAIDAYDRGETALEWAAHQAALSTNEPATGAPAPPNVRAYAEWYDWSGTTLGLLGEPQHHAAETAVNALLAGRDVNGAAAAAQQVAAPVYAAAAVPAGTGEAVYRVRDPRRIAAALALGNVPYFLWWLWQAYGLSRGERFPRQHSFWTIFIPIYGWICTYHVFDDLRRAEVAATGSSSFSPPLSLGLVLGGTLLNRLSGSRNLVFDIVISLVGSGLIAGAGYTWQVAANRYITSRYPGAPENDVGLAEGLAIVLGMGLWAVIIFLALAPAGSLA